MGNGFPVGGVLIHPRFEASYGMLGSTFGGSHLACAAGIAVLDVLKDENLAENAGKTGARLIAQLRAMEDILEVRGAGLMIGLQFDFPVAGLRRKLLFEERVFTGSAADPNTLRLLPPLSLDGKESSLFIEKLDKVLKGKTTLIP